MTGIPEKQKMPFAEGEKRTLQLRIEDCGSRIERVEAEHKRTESHTTHEARYYELKGLGTRDQAPGKSNEPLVPGPWPLVPVFVQLNHGDPADDETRLAAIVEDLLTTEHAEIGDER